MKFFGKVFAPKEVKAALGALDEAEYRFQTEAFKMVRHVIEKSIFANPDALVRVIRESGGRAPRESGSTAKLGTLLEICWNLVSITSTEVSSIRWNK